MDLSDEAFIVVIKLEVPILIVDVLVFGDTTQVRDHDFRRRGGSTVHSSLSLKTRNVELASIFLLSLFLLFRLDLFVLDGQAAEVLIHFLQTE